MLIDSVSYYLSMIEIYSVLTILLFVFPLIMWRSYLRGKGMVFRFLFCIITQTCYISNLVILLGFFKIASRFTLILGLAAEYAIVRWKTNWREASVDKTERFSFKRAVKGLKPSRAVSWLKHKWFEASRRFSNYKKWSAWKWLCDNSLLLLALAAAVVYNTLFLNHSILTYGHSYQFSDIPVHLKWVYELMHGNLFSDGIYPFYMHSMIYAVTTLSGIHLREVSLYYGVYQAIMLILCSYCLSKKLFCNKYLALMPVMLFSVLMNQTRYVASLPQECGMFATMCIAYFMLNFVQSTREHHIVTADLGTKRKGLFRVSQYLMRYHINIDAILIMLSVALVIGYHFYTAIAAIILIFGFALTYFVRFLKKENWVPMLAVGIAGAIIAVTPFAAGLATGMKFQGSMAWATSLIIGEKCETGDTSEESIGQAVDESACQSEGEVGQSGNAQSRIISDEGNEKPKMSLHELLSQLIYNTEHYMFGEHSALLGLLCIAASFALLLLSLIVKKFREISLGYVTVGLYILLMMIFASPWLFGLPEIIQASRSGVFIQPFLFILYVIPIDIVFRLFGLIKIRGVRVTVSVLSVTATTVLCVLLIRGGHLHNYMLTGSYYNENEYVLKNIRETFPEKSFTIVSPTDDYYAVVDEGYHTELSELMYMIDGGKKEFTIPSEYTFFIVEKIAYNETAHESPYVNPKLAAEEMIYTASIQDYQQRRLQIESKAYYWGRAMLKTYPNNFTVYFEDDVVVVYMLRQNTYYPFSLRIDYKSSLPDIGLEQELALANGE